MLHGGCTATVNDVILAERDERVPETNYIHTLSAAQIIRRAFIWEATPQPKSEATLVSV